MLPSINEAPGRGPSPLRSRRRGLLPTQQRLIITAVSAAAGLFCAWLLFGRAGDDDVRAAAAARSAAQFGSGGGSHTGSFHHQASIIQQQQQQQQQQHAAGGQQGGGAGASQLAQLAQQQRPQQQPAEPETLPAAGMADERQWFARLSHVGCRCGRLAGATCCCPCSASSGSPLRYCRTQPCLASSRGLLPAPRACCPPIRSPIRSRAEQLRVCSHRGRLAVEGVAPPGSLSAYAVLYKAGVSCYDIDFMQVPVVLCWLAVPHFEYHRRAFCSRLQLEQHPCLSCCHPAWLGLQRVCCRSACKGAACGQARMVSRACLPGCLQTNDGQLLATHPDDLVAALEAAAGSSAGERSRAEPGGAGGGSLQPGRRRRAWRARASSADPPAGPPHRCPAARPAPQPRPPCAAAWRE